jgi:hypothetical protein
MDVGFIHTPQYGFVPGEWKPNMGVDKPLIDIYFMLPARDEPLPSKNQVIRKILL